MIQDVARHRHSSVADHDCVTSNPLGTKLNIPTNLSPVDWEFLLQRFSMNKSASSFVEQVVLAVREIASKSVGHPIHTVAELQQQIHDDLRRQHPEWIEAGGESPMCEFYEARLRRLLEACARSGPAEAALNSQHSTINSRLPC
jgi:hypothetical protein